MGFSERHKLQLSTLNHFRMRWFQIIFNPSSAVELARMPKELQLQALWNASSVESQTHLNEALTGFMGL